MSLQSSEAFSRFLHGRRGPAHRHWRIVDPLQYFLRLHDERSAQSRLDDVLGSETRNAVAKHELIEIIRTTFKSTEHDE